ncbi:hypothetical protein BAU01nite_14890 [Brevibacterium aurantiacum]|nr:hypothetical protein BAU01nite_14890 [Brevibacterium aurantiacum]
MFRSVSVEFAEVGFARKIDDSPPEQKRKEVCLPGADPIGGERVCCQLAPDTMRRAPDPIVADKRQSSVIAGGGRIRRFAVCEWKLLDEDRSSIDLSSSRGSTDADPYFLGGVDERTYL